MLMEVAMSLAVRAREYSKPHIPSDELKESVQVRRTPKGAEMYLPHYWAVYLHYGRGPAYPATSSVLVYFRKPEDDPRYDGGYPVGRPPRRLTKQEMQYWSRENRQADREGRPRPMVVVGSVGDTEKNRRHPGISHPSLFWTNRWGMSGFTEVAKKVISDEVSKWVRKRLPAYRA
jgi:hypothetical protein